MDNEAHPTGVNDIWIKIYGNPSSSARDLSVVTNKQAVITTPKAECA